MQCPSCSSKDIEYNDTAAHTVCVQCGTVLEENKIVVGIEFEETGDRSQIVGQFVSGNSSQSYGAGLRGRGRYGYSRDSRDATIANAKRVITQVIATLRLPNHYLDKAIRLYSLALQRNFLFGRRQVHVVAAVTYTVTRQENSPHLLIDFSDVLQVNVYVIGQCFLQLIRLLNLKVPIVDPSLFIHRFAARMDLGASANAVALTAMRTIARMKKDWIVMGRRPDGICAAAILLASRAHGFDRSLMEVSKNFRMSTQTISKRLQDFRLTPSAQLTVEQFQMHDILAEFDPPSYIRSQIEAGLEEQEQRQGARVESAAALHDEDEDEEAYFGDESDPYAIRPLSDTDSLVSKHLSSSGLSGGRNGHGADAPSFLLHLDSTNALSAGQAPPSRPSAGTAAELGTPSEIAVQLLPQGARNLSEVMVRRNESRQRMYADIYSSLEQGDRPKALRTEAEDVSRSMLVGAGKKRVFSMTIAGVAGDHVSAPTIQLGSIKRKTSRIHSNAAHVSIRTSGALVTSTSEPADSLEENAELDEGDIAEIESYILSEEEQRKRSAIFERLHRSHLVDKESRRAQKEREAGKRDGKKTSGGSAGDRLTTNAGVAIAGASLITQGQHGQNSKRAKPSTSEDFATQSTAPSAVIKKRNPKKLNISALQGMLDDSGNFVQPQSMSNSINGATSGAEQVHSPSHRDVDVTSATSSGRRGDGPSSAVIVVPRKSKVVTSKKSGPS